MGEEIRSGAALSAAVLAGGRSTRMGRDKALTPLTDGGPSMLAIVLERLRAVADDITIISEQRAGYDAFGAPVTPDDYPEAGVLGGIATALRHAAHEHCLVVACDMPLLSPKLLRHMAETPREYDVLIARLPGESRQGGSMVYQTLHAIYGQACLDPIRRQLATGNRQVIGFFSQVRVRTLDEAEVRAHDRDLAGFFNANTPEALIQAAEMAAGKPEDRSIPAP